ncbi:MAG: hypothetical protein KBC62_03175 [Candidatus Pacebacteria bacterium]|nr:hypothetical protein [Candidatus Paceibacterota bacterium]MBP9842982.1 hypothetical protein [Candidatus Paceibacterota bacterium]
MAALVYLTRPSHYYADSKGDDNTSSESPTQPHNCPTSENFSEKFNQWSIEFLAGHPEYGEKEQREGWDKHLEEMGCIEEQDILDNAICADCEDNAL